MSGHTSGDWRAQDVTRPTPTGLIEWAVYSHEDIPDDGEGGPTHSALLVSKTSSFKPGEAEANARLQAAAPEMLEELKETREWFRAEYSRDDSPEGMFVGTSVEKDVAAIDATIRKAEGRGDA